MTAFIALGCGFLAGLGALAALWLVDHGVPAIASWFERTEVEDAEKPGRVISHVTIVNRDES